MSKNNVVEFEGREASTDPLNELLQAGAQKLIRQAVEAELYAQLEQYADPPHRGRPYRSRSQWLSAGAKDSNRNRAGNG